MTEQQIRYIEIVKDYADKTQSYGCVFQWGKSLFIVTGFDPDNKDYLRFAKMQGCGKIGISHSIEREKFDKCKILGHIFDLSCVLRYIGHQCFSRENISITYGLYCKTLIVKYRFGDREKYKSFEIPNQPPLTLTEQELEQLNNNLEKIGKGK